ncbi:MAG: nucleotidyltransferase [Firmicutes bacterium]|nr:nucleotidyltransferase [Bacillota bacterium]
MSNDPILVVMAAGLGSRYGGLKQIDPVDGDGRVIMDYSLFDAARAGFRRAVCVINPAHAEAFKAALHPVKGLDVRLAYQALDTEFPEGAAVPEGRVKPWGTGHAVLSAAPCIDAPFAVLNADDFYGPATFQAIYDFLAAPHAASDYAMVGFRLKNCLTDNGSVSRGICTVDGNGLLLDVTERTKIYGPADSPRYTEDEGASFTPLSPESYTSLNIWGFQPGFTDHLRQGFLEFLQKEVPANPLKAEYYLPFAVNSLLQSGQATVRVLPTPEKWYGVTYKEDMPAFRAALQDMKDRGVYPQHL